jgi:DNA-binding PadR family transcriptional regulator
VNLASKEDAGSGSQARSRNLRDLLPGSNLPPLAEFHDMPSHSELRGIAILRLIAEEGNLNKYRICRRLVPTYGSEPTILNSIRSLKEIGAIGVVDVNRHARGGYESEYYELSPLGVAKIIGWLEDKKEDYELLDRIANKYARMIPSVFDVWSAFAEAGLLSQLRPRLALHCYLFEVFLERIRRREITVKSEEGREAAARFIKEWEETFKTDALDFVLTLVPGYIDRRDTFSYLMEPIDAHTKKWVEAVRRNNILREAMIRAVSEGRSEAERHIGEADTLIEWLQGERGAQKRGRKMGRSNRWSHPGKTEIHS